jgi:hypothetical protein
MAERVLSRESWTLEAVGNASNMTDDKYLALQGGSSTQFINIKEVRLAGLESANSSPVIVLLARDSTVGATLTNNGHDAAVHPSTQALAAAPAPFTAATTKPQRSSSLHLRNFGFNALGGLFRERAPYGEVIASILGNTASLGEASLSGFTGSSLALVGGHIVYEPL